MIRNGRKMSQHIMAQRLTSSESVAYRSHRGMGQNATLPHSFLRFCGFHQIRIDIISSTRHADKIPFLHIIFEGRVARMPPAASAHSRQAAPSSSTCVPWICKPAWPRARRYSLAGRTSPTQLGRKEDKQEVPVPTDYASEAAFW